MYSPASQGAGKHSASVTNVAWNSQVLHILASSSANGSTIIWDLRAKKPWCQLREPKGAPCSDLCWNPDEGLHLITAIDDDQRPSLRLWDLRSSTTQPLAEYTGHTKGISCCNWCPSDAGLVI